MHLLLNDERIDQWTIDYKEGVEVNSPERVQHQFLQRHGKALILKGEPTQLLLHLGMTGRLYHNKLTEAPISTLSLAFKHTKGIISFYSKDEMRFRIIFTDVRAFGKFVTFPSKNKIVAIERLGPDIIAGNFSLEVMVERLTRNKRYIAEALMHQDNFAGIGNYLRSEILFDAGINPEKLTTELSDEEFLYLHKSIMKVIHKSISHGGCSFRDYRDLYGNKGKMQDHLAVYQRDGLRCLNCETNFIERMMVHSLQFVFFCPNCQR